MTINKKHTLLINSADRALESASKYDTIFHLNERYLHESRACKFKDIAFANLMYNVNSTNNTLNYELIGVTQTPVVIPVGYYSVTSFITAFNTAQANIVIADNATTKTFAFTSASNTKILATSTLGKILGVTTNTANSTAYNANQPYNFIFTNFIHVVSHNLAESDSLIASNNNKYPIIASIPLDVGYGFLKVHEQESDTADSSIFTSHNNLSTLKIRLVDDNFNTIDLNGADWIVSFSIFTS